KMRKGKSMFKSYSCIAILLVGALLLAACNFGLPSSANLHPCSVTTSKQAADHLLQNLRAQASKRGAVTVTATSEEVSSLIEQQLEQYKLNNPGNYIPLEHPVVCFKDGKMTLTGAVRLDQNTTLDGLILVTPAVHNDKAAFRIEQVQLGAFPVPQEFSDQIAALINNTLNQNLDRVALTDIKITEGQLTLTGRVQ